MNNKTYTDSALSDKFKEFFQTYKQNNNYIYVDNIDSLIQEGILEINYDHFTIPIQEMCENISKNRLHAAIYRAISEVFQTRYGSDVKNDFITNDKLKFRIGDETFGRPLSSPVKKDITIITNDDDISDKEKYYTNPQWGEVANQIIEENYYLTVRETGDVWMYDKDKKLYAKGGDVFIGEQCQRLIAYCNRKSVIETVGSIKRRTGIDSVELFDNGVISTLDGIIDRHTFKVTEHSPEYYTTYKLPFNLKSNVYNLKLYNHIMSIIDPADIFLFYELVWILITNHNPFKKMFVFKGLTNTQKTTLSTIITWIIGPENFSYEKPQLFLSNNARFSTNKFVGKRGNIASEIGGLKAEHIENQKSMVGGERQNTERKGDQGEYFFDSEKFVFIYSTNTLGDDYGKITDNSIITRYQFLIFRNQLDEDVMTGDWDKDFFINSIDKQSSIDTLVKFIINYKQAQKNGVINKTEWSTISDTKKILEEEMPIEDQYFKSKRLIKKRGSRVEFTDIHKDFESFTGVILTPQQMGYILKRNGLHTESSNSKTYLKSHILANITNETLD